MIEDCSKKEQAVKIHLFSGSQSSSTRSGYTLLEILLAVSLMTILIAAVTITTGAFAQLSKNGRLQIRQASTIDCIMNDLCLDVKAAARSVGLTGSVPSMPTSDSKFSELTAGTERVLQWDSSAESPYVSLVGNADAVLITREGVNPRIMVIGDDNRKSRAASPQSFLWMSPNIPQTTLACEVSGSQCINRTFQRPSGCNGLLRAQIVNHKLLASVTENEIVAAKFRYWDGKTWQQTWNSFSSFGRLPQAIEIRFCMRSSKDSWRRFTFQMEQNYDHGQSPSDNLTLTWRRP